MIDFDPHTPHRNRENLPTRDDVGLAEGKHIDDIWWFRGKKNHEVSINNC